MDNLHKGYYQLSDLMKKSTIQKKPLKIFKGFFEDFSNYAFAALLTLSRNSFPGLK